MSIFGFPSKNRWLGVRTSSYDCCCKLWKQQMVANTEITNLELLSCSFSSSGASFMSFSPHPLYTVSEQKRNRLTLLFISMSVWYNWRCIGSISFLSCRTHKISNYFGSMRVQNTGPGLNQKHDIPCSGPLPIMAMTYQNSVSSICLKTLALIFARKKK